ncbi:hypothetical protein AVW16_01110 [Crenobacter luteus]|uniref:Uncharacterized protein n=1 Tax=Crenobacter luteus TaxID=1452487 RepID=A0A161S7W6_9NEIS|nr:hypothetical protein AVW16_01110 [Crenobacter luteus]
MLTLLWPVQPIADPAQQFAFDPVESRVVWRDHQDLLVAPALTLDLLRIGARIGLQSSLR